MSLFFSRLSPFKTSLLLHVSLLLVALFLQWGSLKNLFTPAVKKVDFEVIEVPAVVQPDLKLQPQNVTPPKEIAKPVENTQKVFGVSRKAITTSETTANTVEAKLGNTVAKENDDLKLKDSDADSLPIPAEQYLLTKRAGFSRRPQCNRTDEARRSGLVGTVKISVLIGLKGEIIEAKALNDLGEGLKERALDCISRSEFSPAEIEGKPVVTRETISINFKAVD